MVFFNLLGVLIPIDELFWLDARPSISPKNVVAETEESYGAAAWNKRRQGDPLEVAQWLQACHDAGIEVRVQVNESVTP